MTSPDGVSRSRPPTTARPSTSGTMFPGPLCRAKPFRRVASHTPGMAFVRINEERKHLWRAVEQDATCWTSSCRTAGTKAAVRRFFRRLLKRTGAVPRVVITDQRWEETTRENGHGLWGVLARSSRPTASSTRQAARARWTSQGCGAGEYCSAAGAGGGGAVLLWAAGRVLRRRRWAAWR
ncbi:DDE-type integrase/transposase/recombinase [Streptomyces werraensis]|uniref:DDE-type integrase/transposase/recombinase n=1 Tax=Streptomyces werraensis TaxID=68284 RepID=UPI003F4D816D